MNDWIEKIGKSVHKHSTGWNWMMSLTDLNSHSRIKIKKRYLGLVILCISLTIFMGIRSPFFSQTGKTLHAESMKFGANTLLPGSWQSVSQDFLSVKSDKGIGHWIWENRTQLNFNDDHKIKSALLAEENLKNYMEGPQVTHTFPVMDLLIQYRGTPVFTVGAVSSHVPRSLASVSKTITSVGVLLLVQEKRIALNDDIAMYFPKIDQFRDPIDGVPITIRDLLRHTSGISYSPSQSGSFRSKYRNISYVMARQYTKAGETFNYSNFNYYILAALIEKVSGMGFDHYLQARIFKPLNMKHTRLSAVGSGAAGIYSTVDDLSYFMTTLFGDSESGERLLSDDLLKEMFKKPAYVQSHPEMMYYGLGIRVQYRNGQLSSVFHTGLWNGIFAELRYFPNDHASMVHLGAPFNFRAQGVGSYRAHSVVLAEKYVRGIDDLFPVPSFNKLANRDLVLKNR